MTSTSPRPVITNHIGFLVVRELRDPRAALLPVMAAAGGVLLPALIFLALTVGGDASAGWGIPMVTDIAFALGVLALLRERVRSLTYGV